MLVFILACIVSFVPCVALFLWLRNHIKKEDAYKKLCDRTLFQGMLCVFPVILLSGVSYLVIGFSGIHHRNPLLYQALYAFIVLALMEELAKFLAFRRVLKKTDYPYSWLDTAVFMSIVGIGFGLIESVVYAIGASVPVVLVRGICVPHAGYGFVVGYFYGKGLKDGKPYEQWIGFALSWLIHGMYDLSLTDEFLAVNEGFILIPFILAFLDIVLVILLVVFSKKSKEREQYTEPLLK